MTKKSMLTKAKVALSISMVSLFCTSCYEDFIGKGGKADLEVETLTNDLGDGRIDALTIDKKGSIYASQFGQFSGPNGDGETIFKIKKDGSTSIFSSDLSGPLGNAIDAEGNFYAVHNNSGGVSGEVVKISPDGVITQLATIDGFPSGLTLDDYNNVYVSNFVSPTIHKITPEGALSVYANDEKLAGTVGVDFNDEGDLIAGNYSTADVLSISSEGEVSLIANIPDIIVNGAAIGYLIVAENSIFATGIGVNKIFRIKMNGEVSHFAGSGEVGDADGSLLEASFNDPNGITYDKNRKILYISEYSSSAIRKIKL